MNNFQNFGDLNDNVIRSRLREMLMHRATIDRKDFALFDEQIDKDIAQDIEPDMPRNAFEAHQTMGTGLMMGSGPCGMPTHMCSCDRGGKGRKMLKKAMKKIPRDKAEIIQEVINHRTIRKNLKPKLNLKYNNKPNIDVEKNLKKRVMKARANKKFEKAKEKYFKDLYGVDNEFEEPYEPSEDDTEWMGSGKKKMSKKVVKKGGKRQLPQALRDFQEKVREYRKEHGCSLKDAMKALKKNK